MPTPNLLLNSTISYDLSSWILLTSPIHLKFPLFFAENKINVIAFVKILQISQFNGR